MIKIRYEEDKSSIPVLTQEGYHLYYNLQGVPTVNNLLSHRAVHVLTGGLIVTAVTTRILIVLLLCCFRKQ